MRIGAVVSAPEWGGAEVFLLLLSREAGRASLPVTWAVRPTGAVCARLAPETDISVFHDPNLLPSPLGRRGAYAWPLAVRGGWRSRSLALTLQALRDQWACNTVLLQYPGEQAWGTEIARTLGLRVVWIVHSVLHYRLARAALMGRLRAASEGADHIFVISKATAKSLERDSICTRRMVTLPACTDAAPPMSPVPTDATSAIAVLSRLHRAKAVHLLLRALPEVRREFPRARVRIGGSGPAFRRLRREAETLNIADAVDFLGFLKDPRALLAESNLLVHPTMDPGDSMPTVLLEAGAAGLPVVASRWNGIPEVITDGFNGRLTTPGSVPELAAAIKDVLRDPEAAARMGENGRRRVLGDFTAGAVFARFMRALQAEARPVSQ